MQKSVTALHISNGKLGFEVKNPIPYIPAAPKLEHLDINLTKCIKDLYEENYKTLMN